MDKTKLISLAALFVLVIALPVYGFLEKGRMQRTQAAMQD